MSIDSKKTKDEIDMDNYNIKSHLNTSLEAEGISVSEDLVLRTLKAIRQNEAKTTDVDKINMQTRKPIVRFRYARTLVTVAAAALILLVGLSAIREISPLGMKNNMSKPENTAKHDDAGTTEIYSVKEDAAKNDLADYEMKSSKGTIDDINEARALVEGESTYTQADDISEEMFITSLDADLVDNTGVQDKMLAPEEETLSFNLIASVETSHVSEIRIINESTGDITIISNQDQVENFYSIMNKYLFRPGGESDTDIQYKITIYSEDRDSQIIIGKTSVTVELIHNENRSASIYIADNHDKLLEELMDLSRN